MFAILISEKNLPIIKEHQDELSPSLGHFYDKPYLASLVDWYYIRGYVTEKGALESWAAYPEEYFTRKFDYNPEKIKTDWDQIVRK